MAKVQITANFGKKDAVRNGLNSILTKLRDDPHSAVVVVATVRPSRTFVDHDQEDDPGSKIRFLHIEPLSGEDAALAREILDRRFKERTGIAAQGELHWDEGDDGDGDPDHPPVVDASPADEPGGEVVDLTNPFGPGGRRRRTPPTAE
jgi:hypothetical protein